MLGDVALQFGQDAGAPGQIVQRGIGGIAAIAMLARPAPAGLVFRGEAQAGFFQRGLRLDDSRAW